MLSRLRDLARTTTGADRVLLVSLLALSIYGLFFVQSVMPKGTDVVIEVDGKKTHRLPLGQDRVITVHGREGRTVVEIKGGRVRVTESACPNRICIKQGWIDRGAIVCLPNRVVVSVRNESGGESELDAVSR